MSWPDAMKVVEVVWVDSNAASGWHGAGDMLATVRDGGMACKSVGYLFHESDDRVVLVGDQNDNGQVAEAMTIPRVAISSMTTLKEAAS